jgi:choline dehydrogenase
VETIEADYIVVGAGSAGCVVAARLTEDPSVTVLVLEAGGNDSNLWIHIPLGYGKTIADARVNWMYETEPDPYLHDRRVFWPRGKVLGGSSSINGLLYLRGQPEDYDHWRQLGNAGWAWDDVLPYFKRSEGRIGPGDDRLHGRDGPLAVSDLPDRTKLCEAYIQAATEVGLPRTEDFNGAEQAGVGYYHVTARNGRRSSAATAFLHPAMKRPNLSVLTHALATRVVLDGRRATGIAFMQNGIARQATARREIILCGGAINSPHLLMVSGIGPAAHLQDAGVVVRHDLPGVGQNLQDHYQTRITYRCRFPVTLNDVMMSKWRMALAGLQYAVRRSGPLTVSAGQVGIFAKTRPELATPDIQFLLIPFSADRPGEGLNKFSGFLQNCCQLRPESRGEILLRSPDAAAYPAIHAHYLSTELDRRTLVEGLKLGRRIAARPAMQHWIEAEHLPGSDVQGDEALLEHARRYGGSIFHPSGTCKMGRDRMAVVDEGLRVYGLEGLRVADASIMPTVVSGNTNAACIMIGEKAADLVRGLALARAA